MASSNIDQPWMFSRSTATIGGGGDSWYPTTDAFARETESALTKALQQSLFNNNQQFSENISLLNHPVSTNFMVEQQHKHNSNDYYYYNNNNTNTVSASTITVSGSGSEPETPGSRPKGNNNNLGVLNGKTTKRKSRASKRSMTTFIQADPANFRQMVQQVTGVKFEGNGNTNGQFPSSVIKPETVRQPYMNKLQGLLPTLDTSAYLLDHHSNYRAASSGSGLGEDGGVGNDFYAFSCFPTLESSI